GSAGDVARVRAAVARQPRRGGRGAVSAGADDGERRVADLADALWEIAEWDVARAGDVAGGDLHRAADVDDVDLRAAQLARRDLRHLRAVVSGLCPRQQAPIEVSGDVLHADAGQAHHRFLRVIDAVGDDDDAL